MIVSNEYELLAGHNYLLPEVELDMHGYPDKIKQYVIQNFNRDIKSTEAASMINMSTSTFCVFFKKRFGITFIEYVNIVRIEYACKLLLNNNLHIKELYKACGFHNISNFNRQFKRIIRITPLKYRQINRRINQ